MNLRDLKYLVAVAEHGHFGKAADACFVSQPTLSMQIKKLEETLGVQLIERTNKSVLFTAIGQQIAAQAAEILRQTDVLRDMAYQATNPLAGPLHLGVIPTLAPYLLPHIVPALSEQCPDMTLCLVEDKTNNLLKKLSQGTVDAIMVALPLEDDSFTTTLLFEEPFVLATSPKHPLSQRKKVTLSDLENEPILLLEDGHCFRDQALAICQTVHATESSRFKASSLETLRYMVASHAGITLMPVLSCRDNDGVCYRAFQKNSPSRTIGIAWRRASAKSILLQHVVAIIRQQLDLHLTQHKERFYK